MDSVGFENINPNWKKNNVRFSKEVDWNPTSTVLDFNTLRYYGFSSNSKGGNLYSLIMWKTGMDFPSTLNYIANTLGLEKQQFNKKIILPFGGFYKDLIKTQEEPETIIKTYDEHILDEYKNKYNLLFLEDGISFETQAKYEIGYDFLTNRITVPIRTFGNKLCGIMGRLNDKECKHEERWLPIIPCSRSLTLTGYNQNYQTIQEKGIAVIGESEKFPMQLDSFNSYIGLGTSGCHISTTQARYIRSLLVPTTIVAYDEGLEEEMVREEAKKLIINNHIFKNRVGYVWDAKNDILKKGSTASPSDFGKLAYATLMKNYVRWVQ